MKRLNYYLVDVFTNQQFGGNQLAIFPEADHLLTEEMQKIANELNLAETTFIQKAKNENSDCTVRIFTPQVEMPMAGHPTVGTAFTILKNRLLQAKNKNQLIFDEGIGPVSVTFDMEDSSPVNIFMEQVVPEFLAVLEKKKIAEILTIDESEIEANLPVQIISTGVPYIIVPLKSIESVRKVIVRLDLIEKYLQDAGSKEFFIFSRETERPTSTVHCRMFAPELGVVEDPATGSAHGPLGGYLFKYKLSDGKHIISEQGFELGRPSIVNVKVETKNNAITKVLVGGDCVEIGNGTFNLI